MSFVNHCINIFNVLTAEQDDKSKSDENIIKAIPERIFTKDFHDQYRKEVVVLIDQKLPFLKNDIEMKRILKSFSYYEGTMAIYVCILICWIKYNKLEFSDEILQDLVSTILIGTIGFRLFDVQFDQDSLGKEVSILGTYFIQMYSSHMLKIFNSQGTLEILDKNQLRYTESEFAEKRNLWKQCPFKWNDLERFGYKSAPLFSLFELAFNYSNLDDEKITKLLNGISQLAITGQLIDDMTDAEEDLNNGFETLIMTGFYSQYGIKERVNEKMIKEFMNQDRTEQFYENVQNLFDEARRTFTELEDYVLLFFLEIVNLRFNIDVAA